MRTICGTSTCIYELLPHYEVNYSMAYVLYMHILRPGENRRVYNKESTEHDRGVTTHHGLFTCLISIIAHNYFTTPNYLHNYFGDTLHIAHMPLVSRV